MLRAQRWTSEVAEANRCARDFERYVDLTDAEEGYFRAVLPAGFAVPEFDGFDHAAIAGKIDRAG